MRRQERVEEVAARTHKREGFMEEMAFQLSLNGEVEFQHPSSSAQRGFCDETWQAQVSSHLRSPEHLGCAKHRVIHMQPPS